jgi:hypothetical protein
MKVQINRAPVLTLWAAAVAERMGHGWETALTLGKCMAGLNAQRKGRMLGIYAAPESGAGGAAGSGAPGGKKSRGDEEWITVCGKRVPARRTAEGLRAVTGDTVIQPASVRTYLEKAFGESLEAALSAMRELAAAYPPADLEPRAFGLYEKFRPRIASGVSGWGQKGELDLDLVRKLAKKA